MLKTYTSIYNLRAGVGDEGLYLYTTKANSTFIAQLGQYDSANWLPAHWELMRIGMT